MSSPHAVDPDTEPRGFPLPYGVREPVRDTKPDGPDLPALRSRLLGTAVLAGAVMILLTAVGFVAIAADWVPINSAAAGVAIGTVLVGLGAAVRVYLLCRQLPQVAARPSSPSVERPSPVWPIAAPVGTPASPPLQVVTAPAKPEPKPEPVAATTSRTDIVVSPAFTGSFGQWGEVFGELSGRLQSLVHRLIKSIDAMEFEIEDPDLQAMLFEVDHYATLARRQVENIAVLGGDQLQRRANVPVEVNAVLRASVAEIQRYRQVVWVAMNGAEIQGEAIAEIIHLLSELLDNATRFSSDDAPKVTLRAQYVTAGLEIQIQDRGIGMEPPELRRINRLMQDTSTLDMAELFKDGRIGLAVVKELARRHGIGILLEKNVFHGTDASVVIPRALLGNREDEEPPAPQRRAAPNQPSGAAQHRPDSPAPDSGPARPAPVTATAPAPAPSAPPAPAVAPPQPRPEPARQSGPQNPQPTPLSQRRPDPRADDELLPQRQRGNALADLQRGPTQGAVPHPDVTQSILRHDVAAAAAAGQQQYPQPHQPPRPPLPKRRDQATHLPPQLLQPQVTTRPIPGHDTGLLADLQAGREQGMADRPERPAQRSGEYNSGTLPTPADNGGDPGRHLPPN